MYQTTKNLLEAYTRAYLHLKKAKIQHDQDILEIDKIYNDTMNVKRGEPQV